VLRKKILFLSSYGGYGHIATANALKHLLDEEYEIDTVYPIKELQIFKLPSGESIYNFLLANNWVRITNWIVRYLAPPVFGHREGKIRKLIEKYIQEKKPDLIVSLIPFINYPAAEMAEKAQIPYLLVTTDNNLQNWVYALNKKKPSHFKVTIGSDLPTTKQILLEQKVPEKDIETIGLPLRPDFFSEKTKADLRQEYEIPPNKKVVLLVMGGMGARLIYRYAKTIAKNSLGVHLMICTGKNKRLAAKLKTIQTTEKNSIDIIPFTEKIHELFGLADLLITKPGPGTINEAFVFQLPILIDQISVPLFWEEANIDMVLSHKVGACIRSFQEVSELIQRYLYDEQMQKIVSQAYREIPKNQFAETIKPLIEEMCGEPEVGEVALTSRSYSPNNL